MRNPLKRAIPLIKIKMTELVEFPSWIPLGSELGGTISKTDYAVPQSSTLTGLMELVITDSELN